MVASSLCPPIGWAECTLPTCGAVGQVECGEDLHVPAAGHPGGRAATACAAARRTNLKRASLRGTVGDANEVGG